MYSVSRVAVPDSVIPTVRSPRFTVSSMETAAELSPEAAHRGLVSAAPQTSTATSAAAMRGLVHRASRSGIFKVITLLAFFGIGPV